MNQVENALRALRLGPLVWSRGAWMANCWYDGIADPYNQVLIDDMVRQGLVRTRYIRSAGKRKRITGGTVELRAAGAAALKHIETGFHIDIGQDKIEGAQGEDCQRVDRQNGRFCAAAIRESAGA